ncbi:MAG TPA: RDD family protein, partial [Pyrinomonadaceae bacterium]|nr:RDD family protein [Pyrinomonadaceae bacterium]
FREIQQRRAREAALEAEAAGAAAGRQEGAGADEEFDDAAVTTSKAPETGKQLGLVPPPPEAPEMNPIVAAALARVERARSQAASQRVTRGGSHRGGAAAAARVVEEEFEQLPRAAARAEQALQARDESLRAPAMRSTPAPKPEAGEVPPPRSSGLTVVPPKPEAATAPPAAEALAAPKSETVQAGSVAPAAPAAKEDESQAPTAPAQTAEQSEAKPRPRHIAGVIDDNWLERNGTEILPKVTAVQASADDRAPRWRRFVAGVIDLFVVAFIAAPFAAAIELTISNWGDDRVAGSMAGIVLILMFLYHTCSVALAGRTWGMSLLSLHAVDARKASVPRTGQCVRRAIFFILSLLTFGLGLLYSFFDAEGRTAHDLLSGTVVVKE